jgi:UDP-glucose 4-epimerase
LHAAVRQGVKRFIYLSTAHVYGSPLTGVITEENCPISLHPYATSHRAGEDVVRFAHQRGEIEGIVIRLSNAYGAPAHKDANCWMLLVNDLCRQAVTTRRMVLRSSGLQKRDFITLTDACAAIMHLLELPDDELSDGLFNVGGAWSPTIMELSIVLRERAERKLAAEVSFSSLPTEVGEAVPSLNYCIHKLLQTSFKPSANHQAEIDHLLDFCISCFKGANPEDRFKI